MPFRFLSLEPMLDAVSINRYLPMLDWVIVGGESGLAARPFDVDAALAVAESCERQNVPFFLKQLGAAPVCNSHLYDVAAMGTHGGDWGRWPFGLRRRDVPDFSMYLEKDLVEAIQ